MPRLAAWGLALCALTTACYPPIDELVTDEPPVGGDRSCTLPARAPDIATPTSLPSTAFPRATGARHEVASGEDLQAVVDAAERGDEIVLAAGGEWSGPLKLPKKQGSGVIVIRSSALAELPEGQRVALDAAPKLAAVLANATDPAIEVAEAAEGYRLAGLDLRPPDGVAAKTVLAIGMRDSTLPAALPNDIVVDRSLVRGDPIAGAHTGIELASRAAAIIDSTITDVKTTGESRGLSIQSAVGPVLIHNSAVEAAWQNVSIGELSPGSAELFPTDISICKSRLVKPGAWKAEGWEVKSLLEIDRGRRVLISDTLLHRSWNMVQNGYGIIIADEGSPAGAFTEDIAFVNVRVREAAAALTFSANGPALRRVLFENSEVVQSTDRLIQIYGKGPEDLRFIHVTGQAPHSMVFADGLPTRGFLLKDGLFDTGQYGIFGSGQGSGLSTLAAYFENWTVTGNVLVGADASSYPEGNFFPKTFFEAGVVDAEAGNFRLLPESPYAGKASDGRDPGADVDVLEAALAPN